MSNEKYRIHDGGRVKLASGSVDTYYTSAQPTIEKGVAGSIETATRFKELRSNPPLSLVLSFFPDNSKNIKQRLRGAGLYRHLRMDQGPGGNFTAFQFSKNGTNFHHSLMSEQGYALLEYPVQEQIKSGQFAAVIPLIQEIQTAFQNNEYSRTAQLVEQFELLCQQSGLVLPSGESVGSRTGFFFIRPVSTERPTEFPIKLVPEVKGKVFEALEEPESLAEYARKYIEGGDTYINAVQNAEREFFEHGNTEYRGNGLLYFQPDCFVSTEGVIEVEKINMPDVGFFLTQIENNGNVPLSDVQRINSRLRTEIDEVLNSSLSKSDVTLVTRDEVLEKQSDSLELLEIRALTDSLRKLGKNVLVIPLSSYESIEPRAQVLLLNVSIEDKHFSDFVERIIHEDVTCYPDPLLRTFQERATTLRRIEMSGKKLDKFLELIKPKDIVANNAEYLQSELLKYLEIANIKEDILYVSFEGLRTSIPVFKYSIHSFFQIYNAIEKQLSLGKKVESISFSPVPFEKETAVFQGKDGPRLSAFRFMFSK